MGWRLRDLIGYDGIHYAQKYADVVRFIAGRDRSDFAATQAVIRSAHKVMAIKDEFYVAYLLTRPGKYARDRERFGIDEARGDRLSYRHFHQPEIALFGRRWRKNIKTRDWSLKLLARGSFLRRWLPRWHQKETDFREWYLALCGRFETAAPEEYDLWVKILAAPQDVRGLPRAAQRADGRRAPASRHPQTFIAKGSS